MRSPEGLDGARRGCREPSIRSARGHIGSSATVLRSRHAIRPAGGTACASLRQRRWRLRGHDDAGKISGVSAAAAATVDADDDENAKNVIGSSEANEERNAPKAFEGQFSGEVESEFDSVHGRTRDGRGHSRGALRDVPRPNGDCAARRRDALTRWLSSAHPSANTAWTLDALMRRGRLGFRDASSFGSDTAVDGAGFGARRTWGPRGATPWRRWRSAS